MFPIGDDNQGRLTTPVVVYAIIAINFAVFLFLQQAGMTPQGERFTYGYAVVPQEITTGTDLRGPAVAPGAPPIVDRRTGRREQPVIPEFPGPNPIYLTLLTSMFMHGGWLHILGNMLYLWVFGDNIEDNFGHAKFLVFYVICGLAASFAQIAADPGDYAKSEAVAKQLAGGTVPLTIHLLSPARRPVQVTRDLASFWANGYRAVKAELKGRYPRHYWPDDPLVAEPMARAKPRPR